jgi:hypothetical protein
MYYIYGAPCKARNFNVLYRVFHNLWKLLQGVISYVFVIKKVHINMCPILNGYGVTGIFLIPVHALV